MRYEIMENNEVKTERAVLCGLAASSMDVSERSTDISMDELAALVETAGGAVSAGNADGGGAVLTLTLPVVEAPELAPAPA